MNFIDLYPLFFMRGVYIFKNLWITLIICRITFFILFSTFILIFLYIQGKLQRETKLLLNTMR